MGLLMELFRSESLRNETIQKLEEYKRDKRLYGKLPKHDQGIVTAALKIVQNNSVSE